MDGISDIVKRRGADSQRWEEVQHSEGGRRGRQKVLQVSLLLKNIASISIVSIMTVRVHLWPGLSVWAWSHFDLFPNLFSSRVDQTSSEDRQLCWFCACVCVCAVLSESVIQRNTYSVHTVFLWNVKMIKCYLLCWWDTMHHINGL